jgi:hypothetical protein
VKKKTKEAGEIIPKPRTALLQERENDVTVAVGVLATENLCVDSKVAVPTVSSFDVASNASNKNVTINSPVMDYENIDKESGNSSRAHATKYDSYTVDTKANENTSADPIPCMLQPSGTDHFSKGAHNYMSKPRMALFKGREDDEPMTHRDIHSDKS